MNEKELLDKWQSKISVSLMYDGENKLGFHAFDKSNNKIINTYYIKDNWNPNTIDADIQKYFDKKAKEKRQKDWLKIIALVVIVFLLYKFFNRKKGK